MTIYWNTSSITLQLGDESIQRGILLPIYNIEPFDYEILINTTTKSEIPTEWVVFKNEVSLPLQVKSGRLAVEDIFMIMSWDYESNYSDFANEKSLNPQPAIEGVELKWRHRRYIWYPSR